MTSPRTITSQREIARQNEAGKMRSFEELQATAAAILQQCPRLELMSFVRRMGLPISRKIQHSTSYPKPGKAAKSAIEQLEQAGVIELQAPTVIRASVLVCRPGYQPKQPGQGYVTPCTTRIDPNLRGACQPSEQPGRRAVAIPTAVNWRETPSTATETIDMTRTRENLVRVLAAIAEAEKAAIANGTYKLPSRNQLGLSLGLEDYFYAGTIGGKQATTEYNAAQTRLDCLRAERQQSGVRRQAIAVDQPTNPAPVQSPPTLLCPPATLLSSTTQPEAPHSPLPTPDPYQLRLEEDNARLRAEIEALRAQKQQTPGNSDLVLLQALKDEDRQLRLEAAGLLDRLTELEQTRQQLLSNADVIQRLIEQRERAIEQAETAVVAVAATNGHKVLAGVAR